MVVHPPPRMQWTVVGAKRLECGSLLPLCFYAQPTYLEPDRHDAENNVSVPIWPHSIAPLIPIVSHVPPRMQWAVVGAKRLECGSLLPLCFCALTTCLPSYRVIRKIPFAYFASFVVETSQTIRCAFPNPLGRVTPFRTAHKNLTA